LTVAMKATNKYIVLSMIDSNPENEVPDYLKSFAA